MSGMRPTTKLVNAIRIAIGDSATLETLCAAGNPALSAIPPWANCVAIVPEDDAAAIYWTIDGETDASATTPKLSTGFTLTDIAAAVIARIRLFSASATYAYVLLRGD